MTPIPDSTSASKGAYKSWGNTTDRAQRLANANAANPNSLIYHARKRFGADVDFAALTDSQLKQIHADRKARFIDFRQRGNAARKDKANAKLVNRVAELRARADEIESEMFDGDDSGASDV